MGKSILFLLTIFATFVYSDVLLDDCSDSKKGIVRNIKELIAIDKPDTPPDLADISATTLKEFTLSPSIFLSIIAISPSQQERNSGIGNTIYLCRKGKDGLRFFFLLSLEILDQKFEAECTTFVIKRIETPPQNPAILLEVTEGLDYIQANDFAQFNRKITNAYIFSLPENNNIELIACNIPIKIIIKNENNKIITLNELNISISNGKLICKKASKEISDKQKTWLGSFSLDKASQPDPETDINSYYKNSLSLFKSGKKSEAAQTLFKAVGPKPWIIDTGTVGMFNDLGFFLEEAGQFQDAIDVLTEVIAKFPDRTPAFLNIADAYAGLKNNDKAKENYKKYIELMTTAGKQGKIPKRVNDEVR
jgi:hypothetical protein